MPEDILGVALDVLVVANAGSGIGQDRLQGRFSDFQGVAPQVIDTEAEEVKGVEEDDLVVVPVPDEVKVRPAVRATGHCLAIDYAGLAPKLRQGFHNEWEPLGKVVAWTTIEPHLGPVLAGDDPEPVMLDFVQPQWPGGRGGGFGGEARRDETQHPGFLKYFDGWSRIGAFALSVRP